MFAAFVALALSTVRADTPMWGDLEPGAFDVGYTSFWSLDASRTYVSPELGFDRTTKHARPVLVNLWYPASPTDAARMRHADYFDLTLHEQPALELLARELSAYARDVTSQETVGVGEADFDQTQRAAFADLLETATASARDAAHAPGPFPLVLYHAGYGSSFEDNAVLCEFLASHGYIVAGSAFLDGSGESLNIDADRDSEADLQHLIRVAGAHLPVDWNHIAMIGHSGGAHTALRFLSRVSTPLDAAVMLDTTQDYHSFSDHRWDDTVPVALENAGHITMPLLFAARQNALFRLADKLDHAPRLYLTFRGFDHQTFTTHGMLYSELNKQPEAAERRAGYNELCRGILLFLNAAFHASDEADKRLHERWANSAPGVSPVFAEFAEPGQSPPPYDDSSDVPPTPRQMAALVDSGQTTRVGELLERFRDDPRAASFAETEFALSVTFQLVHEQRVDEARALLPHFAAGAAEVLRILQAHADMYERIGAHRLAEPFAQCVSQLSAHD